MPSGRGIDSSTQSTKVEVRDAESGQLVGQGWAPHPVTSPPRSEQDPRDLVASARGRSDRGRSRVPGRDRRHVRRRAAARTRRARPRRRGDPAGEALERHRVRTRRRAGCSASSRTARRAGRRRAARFPSPRSRSRKLSWLHRQEPDAFARIARVLLPHDWLAWRLTGEIGTDRGDASGTGYWSAARGEYRLDLLELVDRELDWAAVLPPVLGPEAAHRHR